MASLSSVAGDSMTKLETRQDMARAMAEEWVDGRMGIDAEAGTVYGASAEGVVETIIQVAVVVAIGVLILGVVYEATEQANATEDTPLEGVLDTFYGWLDSIFLLVAVALIVMVAAVVLAQLRGGM